MKKIDFRKREDLVEEITQIEASLSAIYNNMQYAEEPQMIDYYVFKLKAEQSKHDFLMRKIKEIEWNLNCNIYIVLLTKVLILHNISMCYLLKFL